ncbi:pseudouridine synthase [Paracoccus jeotgali]|uniref:pseudouridine synthase n=1 Tax=Paracoccus jeotgali TaxID=2065379 RepID=UPI001CEFA356|nr:pseudouridine synthase [Paracoccus jeotgali]
MTSPTDPTSTPTPAESTPEKPADTDRIAKVMARAGVASRREAERMIVEGRVSVNGRKIDSPALDVTPADRITVDGTPLEAPQETRLWLYYKPVGLVTTEADEKGRQTVFDALPRDLPRVMSVGRLDLNSEGLLLLTNDGELKRRLELPTTGWLRRYRVRVNGQPNDLTFAPLRRGASIDGEDFAPMEIKLDSQQGANAWLTVGIREGRNREIRRAMSHVGLQVNRLIRIGYGPFKLTGLEPNEVREVKRRMLRDQLGGLLTGEAEQKDRPHRDRGAAGEDRGPGPDCAERRPFARRDGERKPYGDRDGERRPFAARDGERKPYARREDGERKPYGDRDSERKPFARREDRERKPYGDRDSERKPFAKRDGERRPFADRDGERKPFGQRDGERKPFARREDGERKPYGDRDEQRKPYARRDGEQKPYARREDGERKPYAPRDGERKPYAPRDGERKSYAKRDGEQKPYARREDGERKPYAPRDGERKPYAPRDGERKPYHGGPAKGPRQGSAGAGGPGGPRGGGYGSGRPGSGAPSGGGRGPGGPKTGGPRTGGPGTGGPRSGGPSRGGPKPGGSGVGGAGGGKPRGGPGGGGPKGPRGPRSS